MHYAVQNNWKFYVRTIVNCNFDGFLEIVEFQAG